MRCKSEMIFDVVGADEFSVVNFNLDFLILSEECFLIGLHKCMLCLTNDSKISALTMFSSHTYWSV